MDVPEKLRMGAQHHAVSYFRMTVSDLVAGSAKGHSVQETDVVAHYGRFTDDDIGGMVHENPVADFGGRMEIHAELAADDVLEHLGRETPILFP